MIQQIQDQMKGMNANPKSKKVLILRQVYGIIIIGKMIHRLILLLLPGPQKV